ncbi:hypothetical protein C1752_04406 [Acaryochloris thomasi RCC1774]|uniref:Uncharacterized protein n=1 Tax=Acaryochloris thomasi RCC1774 TaxID=1764569 RepID=A0A2W1JDK8_9CYAN|nr:hypothetical protein [Acaryochloris thomasi]PZD71980.1 hypothetical protein C1752_04406 [Acaryochloris thomasi RCC1774]
MTEGLVWSALLLVFIGLGWLGWQEYQKVEAYKTWAAQFERSKYDIYAVLGQAGETLTWGKPTRKGPVDLISCSFAEIEAVQLRVDNQIVDWQQPPEEGSKVLIELISKTQPEPIQVPFTDVAIATDWAKYLHQAVQS